MAKLDMHCHSDRSNLLDRWFYYKMGAKECYTRPDQLYNSLKRRGMDFVTITDHDTIQGALELAEKYNDAFLSCEFTVHFLKEEIDVHICAYDLSEEQFRMGRRLSDDVREFAAYFHEQQVVTSVAHPLHSFGSEWKLRHLEQLILLFENFEEKNGLLMESINSLQSEFLDKLSPEMIESYIEKYKIEPCFQTPWIKGRTAGSDDHSSYYLARCWAEVDEAKSVGEFLSGVQGKQSKALGQSNNALTFAHTIQINVAKAMMNNICDPGDAYSRANQLATKLIGEPCHQLGFVQKTGPGQELEFPFLRDQERKPDLSVGNFLSRALRDWSDPSLLRDSVPGRSLQDETFCVVNTWVNNLVKGSLEQFTATIFQGRVADAVGKLGMLVPAALMTIPYLESFRHCHSNKDFRNLVVEKYGLKNLRKKNPPKWAWFTDTMSDINGVAHTIQTMTELADEYDTPITAVTCSDKNTSEFGRTKNFTPVFSFSLPEYDSMSLCLPPLLEMLCYCEEMKFTRFIISTPGPVGLIALWIARVLGIETAGIFHTDVPSYVRILTQDKRMESTAWAMMRWFYGGMDRVFSLTEAYRDLLIDNGLRPGKISLFPKGTDINFFHPDKARTQIWDDLGIGGQGLKLLYVGRVSKEKNIDLLCDAYLSLEVNPSDLCLVVVGDGPCLEELKSKYKEAEGVVFTGFIKGQALSEVYASADIFAFPSTTDTYGSAVLEAQASGLPAIVTNVGGPQEVIVNGSTGLVVEGKNADALSSAIAELAGNEQQRKAMGRQGRLRAEQRSWKEAFDRFWKMLEHPETLRSPYQTPPFNPLKEAS